MAQLRELLFKLKIVLDDAVVDDGDLFVVVVMRVGVQVGGTAVGRPSRVGNRLVDVLRAVDDQFAEFAEFAGPLDDLNLVSIGISDPRAVVSRYSRHLSWLNTVSMAFLGPT